MTDSTLSTPTPTGGGSTLAGLIFGRGPADTPIGAIWVSSLFLLGARVWLALPFWNAGTTRLESWSNQPFLFEWIHPVPFLSPTVAAYLTTVGEIVLPILLVLGLLGRFAGLGLAVMAATIYFIVGQTDLGIENGIAIASEQVPWMVVGLVLFIIGPGRISLDYGIRRARLGES